MRAIAQRRFGGPEVLETVDLPRPEPLPTELLVRVHAAGVNPVDWKTRAGAGMAHVLGPPPFVLGWDVSGTVEAVGFGVTTFAPGDEVYGMPWFPRAAGAYAEFLAAPARQFARKPRAASHETSAAIPLAALTAWQALTDTADVRPGQRVMITAAAGGVGHFAVQFAKHHGAHVVAVASARHHGFLRSLGADEVVDYTAVRFETSVSDIDVVIDPVGDGYDRTSTRALSVVRSGGLLVVLTGGASDTLRRDAEARGIRATGFSVEPDGPALARIASLVDAGDLHVEVAASFDFDEVARAHESGESGRTRGKLVLRMGE